MKRIEIAMVSLGVIGLICSVVWGNLINENAAIPADASEITRFIGSCPEAGQALSLLSDKSVVITRKHLSVNCQDYQERQLTKAQNDEILVIQKQAIASTRKTLSCDSYGISQSEDNKLFKRLQIIQEQGDVLKSRPSCLWPRASAARMTTLQTNRMCHSSLSTA